MKIVGDDRAVIPVQRNLQVQVREGADWKTAGELKDAAAQDGDGYFPSRHDAAGLRIFVPAADLPHSERADVDGIVRICELLLILPDGQELALRALFGR